LADSILVRPANANDLKVLVAFNIAMALETEGKNLDQDALNAGVAAVLEDGLKGFYLLAEFRGNPVGQLLVTSEWSDWRNAYFWWIQSVYVSPEHRRRGVYRAMDQQVRVQAKLRGNVCGVRLYVDRQNHGAQKVYSSLGMLPSHYDMYELEISE
jgi:GNAT superfamily N-acetyltransferase